MYVKRRQRLPSERGLAVEAGDEMLQEGLCDLARLGHRERERLSRVLVGGWGGQGQSSQLVVCGVPASACVLFLARRRRAMRRMPHAPG
eukprot:SAG31_NODE_4719_length_3010_cov_1.948128_1_plen_89_part_00